MSAAATPAVPDLGLRSLAVLPFRALDLQHSHRFVREALLGSLIGELSRLPHLSVISRGTMLRYLDESPDPVSLRRDLGVTFVVDGAMQCQQQRLIIDAELVDARHGRQISTERIELSLSEWPRIGELFAGRLARALQLGVAEGTLQDPAVGEDPMTPGLESAMRAWVELYCRAQSRATNDRAWSWANRALEQNVSLGTAWNALAYCKWRAAQYGWSPRSRRELLDEALHDASRAIGLAPRDPDAHYSLALIAFAQNEPLRAEAALRHCLTLCPSYAPAHGLLGLVRAHLGFPRQAAQHCGRAFELSPSEPLRAIWHWSLAAAALMLGENREALHQAQRGIAANPDYPACHIAAGVAALRLGDHRLAGHTVTHLMSRTTFKSVAEVAARLPAANLPTFGPQLLDDLRAAGLPDT